MRLLKRGEGSAKGSQLHQISRSCDPQSLALTLTVYLGSHRFPTQHGLVAQWPESFDKLHTPVLPHDYLNFVLSGVYAMECGDASGVGTSRCGETWRARAVSWHVCNALWVQRDAA